MKDDPDIRPLAARDLREAAALHLRAFPDSALTALGPESVRRYYEWQLTGPHETTALGVWHDGALAGFCFGGHFRGAMSGFLRRNRLHLAVRVATHPWLLANPLFRERLTSGLRILRRFARPPAPPAANPQPKPRRFGILSIAVDPRLHGLGLGKRLMQEAEACARRQAFPEMQLTVHPDNAQAIRFYEGLGWQKHPAGAAWTGEMRKSL
ncbi:MAG: N-acetyltransferase [Blastocatellia bacterium]|nr:N-acetyltransferase [Blastocatellia bacterium]